MSSSISQRSSPSIIINEDDVQILRNISTSTSLTSSTSTESKTSQNSISKVIQETKTESNTTSSNTQQENIKQLGSSEFSIEEQSIASVKPSYMELNTLNPVVKSFIVGSISGTCSTVLFQPLDLIKTRLQSHTPSLGRHGHGGGILTLASSILKHENILGFWKGMTPSLTRCVPGVGLYFSYIHGMRSFLEIDEKTQTALESVILGASGRCFSGAAMIPFTVIKTRLESRVYEYGSIRQALNMIWRSEGIRGLTCGLLPTLLRDAPFSGIYLMIYNYTKQNVSKEWIDGSNSGPYVRFSCGIIAGIGASIVTQPPDVIKTKMQLYPEKFHRFYLVVPYVYHKYGIRGYFKGLMPRTVRRTLVAAMSWTVYEQLIKSIGLN